MVADPTHADPELDAAVGVGVVPVRSDGAVEGVTTVGVVIHLVVAVLVTLVTDRPGAAVSELLVVAAVVLGVEHHGVALLVVRAEQVLGRVETARLGAVPEPPAVELVREPGEAGVLAPHPLLGRGAVPGGGGSLQERVTRSRLQAERE